MTRTTRDQNGDGALDYKYLKLPVSIRRKRRFVRFVESTRDWTFYDYERVINLRTNRLAWITDFFNTNQKIK